MKPFDELWIKNEPATRKAYEYIHQHPELSFEEKNTSAYIAECLKNIGVDDLYHDEENIVIGIVNGEKDGSCIGLRAELDALPIEEKTGVSFASKNRHAMHACGHDLHMACALGAAKMLSDSRGQFSGKRMFIFQPGEEKIPGGAQSVMQAQFFKDNSPDLMLALHSFPDLEVGKVGFRPEAYMASSDEIDIHITGSGGHAAMPHKSIDTVLVASHIVVALQQIRSRFIPPVIPAVLSFGNIAANSVMNILPEKVSIEGTFRIMNEDWREKSLIQIEKIARKTAEAYGAGCDVVIRNGFPSVFNDKEKTQDVKAIAEQALGKENVVDLPVRLTADDFGYFTQQFPSVYFRLGTAWPDQPTSGLHTSTFLPHPEALCVGVRTLCEILMNS